MRSSFLRNWLCGIVLLLLSACGGGGSSDSSTTGTTTPDASTAEGHFIDSAVSGLTYICGDITGITDENGTFTYYVDQEITFMIGDVVLGTASGASIVTPIGLVDGAKDETNETVINLLRFIQSLDNDGNLSNGINITTSIASALTNTAVNFRLSVTEFESTYDSLIEELPSYTDGSSRKLVSQADALEHFAGTGASGGDDSTDSATFSSNYFYFEDIEMQGDISAGDYNNDGFTDIVFSTNSADRTSNGLRVMFGSGDGTFTEYSDVTTYGGPRDFGPMRHNLVTGDFNGDGVDDFAFHSGLVERFFVSGDNSISKTYFSYSDLGSDLFVLDLNDDEISDLVSLADYSSFVDIFHFLKSNASGDFDLYTFGPYYEWENGGSIISASTGDFDGDGIDDILTFQHYSDDYKSLTLWSNLEKDDLNFPNKFSFLPSDYFTTDNLYSEYYTSLSNGDFDNDGDLDVAIVSSIDFVLIMVNDGKGGFSDSSHITIQEEPVQINIKDYNNDRILDVAILDSVTPELIISFGNGDGTFTSYENSTVIEIESWSDPYQMISADLNNDGVTDIVIADCGREDSRSGTWGAIHVFLSPGFK